MNIMVDAHFLDKKMEGNRTFVLALIAGLEQVADAARFRFFFMVFCPEKWQQRFKNPAFVWLKCSENPLKRYLTDFPRAVKQNSIDLIQHTYHFPPFFISSRVRRVLVVHDILPLQKPELFSPVFRLRFNRLLRRSVKTAHCLVCGSHFTLGQLQKKFPAARERIRRIPYGVLPEFFELPIDKAKKDKKKGFVLYVGRLNRRKGIDRLLDLAQELQEQTGLFLLLAGRQDQLDKQTRQRIEQMAVAGMVKTTGEISGPQLKQFFSEAAALLYFPISEGFGYPVLEAMAGGVFYLTADSGAVTELALPQNRVSLEDGGAIVKKIRAVLEDEDTRQALIAENRIRAAEFTAPAMAEKFLRLYGELT